MVEYTFSEFVYFDTNIISHLAKNRSMWSDLLEFLRQNDLTLGLGTAQVAELSDARKLHSSLVELLMSVPSGLLKTWDIIIAEEVKAHPHSRTESLLLNPLNQLLLEPGGLQNLYNFLSSEPLSDARQDQLAHAEQMAERHTQLKKNFPPSKTGSYTREQADEFTFAMICQWLVTDHRDFLGAMQQDIQGFHPEVFLSIRLYAQVLFYKYYLGRREPKKLSDFGDTGHLFYIPYCKLAVMERDLCNVLNQIKRHHDTLDSTVVRNIEFFDDWEWD